MHFPDTLVGVVIQKLSDCPDAICFYSEDGGGWKAHTHRQFHADILRAAHLLTARGVSRGDRVGVIGPPSYEWEVADKAIMFVGGITVGIDGKSTPADLSSIIDSVSLSGLFAEDAQALARIPDPTRKSLGFVYVFTPTGGRYEAFWAALSGAEVPAPMDPVTRAEDIGSIIFTSGTTGRPKGIPLKQRQLAAGFPLMEQIFRGETGHRTLAWTPFYNITGRMMECNNYFMDVVQYLVKDPRTLIDRCKELHPTYLVVLPRILEKVHEGIAANLARQPAVIRALFRLLMGARRHAPWGAARALTDALLIRRVRQAVWGNSLQFLITGSAPVDAKILRFFDTLGIPTYEVYGMSECGFLISMNRPGSQRYGSVGQALDNVELKIAQDGEVLVKTDMALARYWSDVDGASLYSADGYLKTGDLGELHDGYLRLTGRKKEIIKTSTGLRVPPVAVETVYQSIAGVENVVVIGNRRKFLSALVTLDEAFRADLEGRAIDASAYLEQEFARRHAALSPAFQCKKFTLLARPLSVDEGEITPTLKVRRLAIEDRYSAEIEAMYTDDL